MNLDTIQWLLDCPLPCIEKKCDGGGYILTATDEQLDAMVGLKQAVIYLLRESTRD